MEDINLIPGELRSQRANEERAKSLLIVSVVLLIVSFIFSGGVYVYKMLLEKNIAEISYQVTSEEEKIKNLAGVESKMMVLGSKVSYIYSILSSRAYYSTLLSSVGSMLPEGVSLTELSSETETKVAIGGITPSYNVLAELIKNITEDAKTSASIFDYPELTSVSLKEDINRIEFSMNLFLKKDALKDNGAK